MSNLGNASQARPGEAQIVAAAGQNLGGHNHASAQASKEAIESLQPDQYDPSSKEHDDAGVHPATLDGP